AIRPYTPLSACAPRSVAPTNRPAVYTGAHPLFLYNSEPLFLTCPVAHEELMMNSLSNTFGKILLTSLLSLPLAAFAQDGHSADDGHDHGPSTRTFKRDFSKTEKVLVEMKVHEGVMKFELNFKAAPNTVANFMHLADSGLYKGTVFHRVIQGFMIQGGDPKGDGT